MLILCKSNLLKSQAPQVSKKFTDYIRSL